MLLCRTIFGLLLALAVHAAVFQSAQAASCDISDLGCIAKDFKASLNVKQGSFESEYQQFAEMIAPVLLLAHGGNFEASLSPAISTACVLWLLRCAHQLPTPTNHQQQQMTWRRKPYMS